MNFFSERGREFLNAASLVAPQTLTIGSATREKVRGQDKLVIRFIEIPNPWIVNRTNAIVLVTKFGPDVDTLVGKRITLEALPTTYAGTATMGIRVVDTPADNHESAELIRTPPTASDWAAHIDNYLGRRWRLLPLPKYSKKPFPGEHWVDQQFDRSSLLENVIHEGNLAVEAGASKLVILDLDIDKLPKILDPNVSLTQKTARGYQIFLAAPFDSNLFASLKQVVPELDVPRVDAMYAVLPLSRTCTRDHGSKHGCKIHDLRMRAWIGGGLEAQVIPFVEFARRVLK